MNLDVRALGRFSRLADDGAARAAASLSLFLGGEVAVESGRVAVASVTDVREAVAPGGHGGVAVPFGGAIDGTALLVVARDDVPTVLDSLSTLVDGDETLAVSGLRELGNVLLSGFVDGWSNHLGAAVASEPPVLLDEASLVALLPPVDVPVLSFQNHLLGVDSGVEFGVYLLPSPGAVETLFATDGEGLRADRLLGFAETVRDGASRASGHVTALTGIETTVEVADLSFAPVEHLTEFVSSGVRVGVVLELVDRPGGFVVVLFDEASADHVVEALLPGTDDESMRQSAIMEVGNILTSGFVDGWANELGTTIDISPPKFVHDMAPAILDPVVVSLATAQDVGLLVESQIRTDEGAFTCEIYVVPEEQGLAAVLAGDESPSSGGESRPGPAGV
jgi:chemotaxis protein CheC